jgi:hypothetical protein
MMRLHEQVSSHGDDRAVARGPERPLATGDMTYRVPARAAALPDLRSGRGLLDLQRTAGNAAVSRLVSQTRKRPETGTSAAVARTPAILQRWWPWDWLTSCFGSGTAYENADDEREGTELEMPERPSTTRTVGQGETATVRIGDRVFGGYVSSCAIVLAYGTGNGVIGVYHWPGLVGSPGYRNTFSTLCSSVRPLRRIYIVSNDFLGNQKLRDAYIREARNIRTTSGVDTQYLVIDSDRDLTPFLTLTSDGPVGIAQKLKSIDLDAD